MAPILLVRRRRYTGTDQHVEAALPVRTIAAEPEPLAVDIGRMALVIIDMQRDFLEPGGFGAALGNDVSRLKAAVGTVRVTCSPPRGAPAFSSSIPAKATEPI